MTALTIQAAPYNTYLSFKIELSKDNFVAGEKIEGKVIIESFVALPYPVTFQTKIFKDGKPVNDWLAATPVFFGMTELNLKTFLISEINTGADAIGKWRIVISSLAVPEQTAEVSFTIEK